MIMSLALLQERWESLRQSEQKDKDLLYLSYTTVLLG